MNDDLEYQFVGIAEEYKVVESDPDLSRYELEVNWPSIAERLPEPPARVLDYGCGGGVYTRMLLAEGYDVLAVDNVTEMVDELRDLEGFAKQWSYQDTSLGEEFDVIIAKLVVQFVVDLPVFAKAMYDHLVYGGKLVISVPHPSRSAQLLTTDDPVYESPIGQSGLAVDMIHRELAEYKNVIEGVGFELVETFEPIDVADPTAQLKRLNMVFER